MKRSRLPDVAKPTPKGIVLVKAWQLADEAGTFIVSELMECIEKTHPDLFSMADVHYFLGKLVEMGELAEDEVSSEGLPFSFKRAEKPWKVYH